MGLSLKFGSVLVAFPSFITFFFGVNLKRYSFDYFLGHATLWVLVYRCVWVSCGVCKRDVERERESKETGGESALSLHFFFSSNYEFVIHFQYKYNYSYSIRLVLIISSIQLHIENTDSFFFLPSRRLSPWDSPCSCLVLSTVWQAIRHSCSSGDGISPADPPTVSSRACHQ